MLLIDSGQWFGPGLIDPVLGARHQSVAVTLRDFGQFADTPITASAFPLLGWPEPFVVELFQLDDRAAYLATERDVRSLVEDGVLAFAVLDSLYSWASSCMSYRLVSLHTDEATADAAAEQRYLPDDDMGHRADPATQYIARKAIEACGRWVDVVSRPRYDQLDDPYQVWYQQGGQGPHAGQYIITSRRTLAEAQDDLRHIAEQRGAQLHESGLSAHLSPPPRYTNATHWFIVAPDGTGQDMLWPTGPTAH